MKGNLKKALAGKLKPNELDQLYKSYDLIGDIAVVRVPELLTGYSELIAQTVMQTHKEVKSVWRQTSSVSGDYRLRNLQFILGKKSTQTRYKEHGCIYETDLQKTYFSPRLSFERLRIAKLVQESETIVNMFAGVGCYSIAIAQYSKAKTVYSIDVNPLAFGFLVENVRLNKLENTVVPLQGDAKTVIQNKLQNIADRVLMPLPELAYQYLDCAVYALKSEGGWIHLYDFVYAKKDENPVKKAEEKVTEKLSKLCKDFSIKFGRVVRPIGPHWYQVVVDINLQK
ncbi:MAG: class I SAM-dependent methyltransferase family protein [Candidatus Bathyarchaeota archaeon]|nr:class I SAM-dependent methyltransferase family protein [Candidatus Bathyarchaeota archaeon]